MKKQFKDRNILLWLISSFVCVFGDVFTTTAMPLLIYSITKSPQYVVLTYMVDVIPEIIIGPFIGTIVDQYDKKKIIVYSSLFAAGILLLAIIFNTYYFFIAANCLLSIANLFYSTTSKTVLPFLVKEEADFSRVNSFISFILKVARILGVSCATTMLIGGLEKYLLIVDAMTFVLTAILVKNITLNIQAPAINNTEELPKKYSFTRKIAMVTENKPFLVCSLCYGLLFFIEGIINTQALIFLEKDQGLKNYYYGFYCNSVLIGVFAAQIFFAAKSMYEREMEYTYASIMGTCLSIIIFVLSGRFYIGIFIGFFQSLMMNCWFSLYYRVISATRLGVVVSIAFAGFAVIRLVSVGSVYIACQYLSATEILMSSGALGVAFTIALFLLQYRNIKWITHK